MRLQQPFSVRWHCGPVASSSWPPSLVPLPATGLSDVLVPSWMIMMHARNQTSQHLDKYVRRRVHTPCGAIYCLLQACAYQPGLVWASQKCNRWRHKACIPNTDGEAILHHLIDVYNINVTINQIMYLSCTTVATCCQVFSES